MEYLISSAIGYLLGSFPSAYIFLKKTKGIDVTKEGTGNVGAMNSFEITNSKLIGFAVFLFDFLKGTASVFIPSVLYPDEFIFPAIALLFAVFSHCYNPWIKFKGGRGLATAAGGSVLIFPFLLFIWAVLWVMFYLMRKNILFANIIATGFSLFVLFGSYEVAVKYAFPQPKNADTLILTSCSILIVIFIKHIEPLKELIMEFKNNRRR
ncbi:MAG: glycerol-3-phosphate acyltransferase [Ignavibacteriaceae bacterium]|nr:glycerol-3-phosphate acyltransferase [Ignavibacteriaceae bacterium]